jgi:hypothetical protein
MEIGALVSCPDSKAESTITAVNEPSWRAEIISPNASPITNLDNHPQDHPLCAGIHRHSIAQNNILAFVY